MPYMFNDDKSKLPLFDTEFGAFFVETLSGSVSIAAGQVAQLEINIPTDGRSPIAIVGHMINFLNTHTAANVIPLSLYISNGKVLATFKNVDSTQVTVQLTVDILKALVSIR